MTLVNRCQNILKLLVNVIETDVFHKRENGEKTEEGRKEKGREKKNSRPTIVGLKRYSSPKSRYEI